MSAECVLSWEVTMSFSTAAMTEEKNLKGLFFDAFTYARLLTRSCKNAQIVQETQQLPQRVNVVLSFLWKRLWLGNICAFP